MGLTLYFTETKATDIEGTFKPYAGKSNKDINHTWKLERFLERFPEYAVDEDVKIDGKRTLLFKSQNTWVQIEIDPTSEAILKLTFSRANLWWK